MAEGDTVGTASVNIEAIITVNEESLTEAKATIASGLNADVSTPEGRPAGRGRRGGGTPAAAQVDATVKAKMEGNIAKDVQSLFNSTEFRLIIDTVDLRDQVISALKAPFKITIDAEVSGSAASQERIGVTHGAAAATGSATSRAPIPQEITQLLRENKGALATNINNLYRNINEAFAAAGRGGFGRVGTDTTGQEVQKLGEIMEHFGSSFGDLASLTKTNKLTGGSLSPKELGAALGLEPTHPAVQTVATAGVPGLLTATQGGVDPARKIGILMSRVANYMATAPVAAPAAAAERQVPAHEVRAADTTARVDAEKQRADAKQAVIAERQASLRVSPLTSAGFPVSPPLERTQTQRSDPEADTRARQQLGGRERANVRRLRGRGTEVGFGDRRVDLESYLRAAEMGQFQDVYEQFGGKGGRESQGLRRFEAQDVGGFDELSRLGTRKPGTKFSVAGQEGRFARVGPQEALIRTIISDLGVSEDQASADQIRESLAPQMETIRKAVGAGASPLSGTSGATKRGQGAPSIEGASDLGAQSKRLFEIIDVLDGKIKSYSTQLDRVNTDIEKLAGSGQDTGGLEAQATDLSKEIQRFRSIRSDAQRQRETLNVEPNPANREATRLRAEQSRRGVAEGIGFTEAERHDRQLASPGAQGRYGASLLEEMGLPNGPETIRSALIQRHLANQSRIDPTTGSALTGRSTIRQAAFGPTGRAPRNPGEDAGIFGELVSQIPADMGPGARKVLVNSIRELLQSTIEDEGFKRDIAEVDIGRKEGATLRPVLTGMTGEGQYTKTPPGILGSLRARIAGEERLGPGHGKEAHGDPTLHEELEDVTEYGVGVAGRQGQPRDPNAPGGATIIPGLRSQLRALEERDEIIAAEEDKAMRTRNASIAKSTGLSGDETMAMARAAGVAMEPEENAPPFAAFGQKYGAGGAGAGGAGGGGGGAGGGFGITGGAIPVFVTNWPAGWNGSAREMRGEEAAKDGTAYSTGTPEPEPEVVRAERQGRPADPRGARDQAALERAMEQDFVAALRGANDPRAQQAYEKRVEQREQKYLTGTNPTPAERNFLATLEKINKPQPVAYSADPQILQQQEMVAAARAARERDRMASQAPPATAAESGFLAALQQANRPERAAGRPQVLGIPSRERAMAEAQRAGVSLNLAEPGGVTGLLTSPPRPEVLRANAARQRAQRSLPQRAISTSFVQIAENLFGGLDAPQQRLATLANRTQDLSQLGNRATRLQEGRGAVIGEQRALIGGIRATEAAGGDAREQRARFAGLRTEFIGLTKESKNVAAAMASGAEEIEGLAKAAVTTTDVVRNLAAGAVGGVAGGLAAGAVAQGTQAVIQVATEVLAPIFERLSGFGGATGRTQTELAQSLRANNDKLIVTLSEKGIQARLSDDQLAQISQPLGQRTEVTAGTQSLAQQFELFNVANAIERQGQGGLDRGLTRTTGGLFDVRLPFKAFGVQDISIGGQASTAETLTNQLQQLSTPTAIKAAAGATKINAKPGLGEEGFDLLDTLFGATLGGPGGGRFGNVEPDTKKQQQLIDENNAQLEFLNSNLHSFRLVQEGNTDALDKQATLFAKGGAADLGGRLRERGVVAQGVQGPQDVAKFLAEFAAGPKLSARQLLEQDRPQIQAQMALEDMQRRFQLETVNPQTFAMAEAARPLAPAATGINTTGLTKEQAAGVNAELAETQKLYDQIGKETEQGTDAAKAFVAETFKYDPTVGEDFAKSLDHVADIGRQITTIEIGLQTKQAAYSAAQFSYQIDIAKRSLADAKGLVSGVGDSLGAVERRIYDLQRQSQSLSLGQSQRQINFQRAVANFQAPGLSSEEAEARIEQAKTEADFAQKQLNIQKQLFGLSGRGFNIQANRQVRDLGRQIDLLERGRVLQVETAAAEKKILALTKIQAKENKQVETFYNSAVTRTADVQSEIAKLVAATEEGMSDVGKIVLDAFKTSYSSFIDVVNGGNGTPNSSGGPDDRNAMGFIGSVNGATSLGKYGVAGEAGGEAVAIVRSPRLLQPTGGGGSVNSFTVVINNPVVKSDDDKRKLIADVKRAIQSEASMLLPRRA